MKYLMSITIYMSWSFHYIIIKREGKGKRVVRKEEREEVERERGRERRGREGGDKHVPLNVSWRL